MASRPQSFSRRPGSSDSAVHHTPVRSRSQTFRTSSVATKDNAKSGEIAPAPWVGLLKRFRPQAVNPSSLDNAGSGLCAGNIKRFIEKEAATDPCARRVSGQQGGQNNRGKSASGRNEVNNIYRRPRSRSSGLVQGRGCVSPVSDIQGLILSACGNSVTRRRNMWSDQESESLGHHQDVEAGEQSCTCGAGSVGERQRSILRRSRSASVPAITSHPPLVPKTEERKRERHTLQKQTSFLEDVQVIYYSEEEQANTNLLCQSEKLKDGAHLEVHYTENYLDINENCLNEAASEPDSANHNSPAQHAGKETVTAQDKTGSVAKRKAPDENSEKVACRSAVPNGAVHGECKELQSVITKTSKGIRLEVEIDSDCLLNRTCVKAMSGGRTLIVMTYRLEGQGQVHQYVDKINLPVMVNPYAVRAQVKHNGHLSIEAPFK